MDTSLRHSPGQGTPEYDTVFDFSDTLGIVRAAEKCNGSGDCRKGPLAGGTMCPSYMATREEKHTTRARANILRQILTDPPMPSVPSIVTRSRKSWTSACPVRPVSPSARPAWI